MFARIVITRASTPSSRKKLLRAAISSGNVLKPGPVEAILMFSAALRIDWRNTRINKIATSSRNPNEIVISAQMIALAAQWLAFFCRDVSAAKSLGAIPNEHERLGAEIGNLVVVLGAEEDDLVFADDALCAFDSLD